MKLLEVTSKPRGRKPTPWVANQPQLIEKNGRVSLPGLGGAYDRDNLVIHPDGTIDVDGNVVILENLTKIPYQFGHVTGFFECSTKTRTLQGAPREVGGNFICSGVLASFEHAPSIVRGSFRCWSSHIDDIRMLALLPKQIGGDLAIHDMAITNFSGINKVIPDLVVGGQVALPGHATHVLGFLRIPGIRSVKEMGSMQPGWAQILDRYLARDRSVFLCQNELLDAGFEEQAQL